MSQIGNASIEVVSGMTVEVSFPGPQGPAGGGGGGDVATDLLWDAKGDLAVGTGADTAVRLPVGTNGHIIVADSSVTAGMKWVAPAKATVGLGNVDNTSDLNKPVSTATQTALDGKADSIHTHPDATGSTAGFMSASDKTKLDGIASGATANTGTVTSVVGGTGLTGGTITTSGTLAVDFASTATAGKVVEANDARLSDSRTPTAHTHGLTESYVGEIAAAADQDYTIDLRVPVSRVVTEFSVICASGTCTAALKNGANTIVGSVSVSSSIATKTGGDLNATHKNLSANDKVVLTISSNSSALRVQFCVKYTATTGAIS